MSQVQPANGLNAQFNIHADVISNNSLNKLLVDITIVVIEDSKLIIKVS